MTGCYGPVTERANHLDHAAPESDERAHETRDERRPSTCPVAYRAPSVNRFPRVESAGEVRRSVDPIRGSQVLPVRILHAA